MSRFSVWWTEAKGSARSLDDVLGDLAVIQRCQVHKPEIFARTFPSLVTPTCARR